MLHSTGFGGGSGRTFGRPKTVRLLAILLLCLIPRLAQADDAPAGWRPRLQGNLDVKQLIEAGGIVGILLCSMSIATFALTLEHLVSLRRNAVNPRKLAEQAHQLMQQRQFQIAAKLCRDDGSLLGFVLAAGLSEVGNGYAVIEKAMEDACAQYSARLYRKIDYLSVIGTLSPMIGLVGTVWGMMIAFSEFA